jgi:hypothetical protein
VLKSAGYHFYKFEEKKLVFLHFKSFILSTSLVFGSVFGVFAQAIAPQATPAKEEKKNDKAAKSNANAALTAEQVAELTVFVYGRMVGGRDGLKQIRKTSVERGKISINNTDGTTENAIYEIKTMRGDSLDKEKIRFDQEFPSSRFALLYNDNKIIGVFNDSVFTPREEASKGFQSQIWHSIEALLRYKENGATVKLVGKEKYMGAEYHVLELTDKENRQTKFYVSAKLYRVMWLEYMQGEVKYQRRFYDYREAQGTLVPYRSVLFANGKQVEETNISTVTYGQRLEESLFQTN